MAVSPGRSISHAASWDTHYQPPPSSQAPSVPPSHTPTSSRRRKRKKAKRRRRQHVPVGPAGVWFQQTQQQQQQVQPRRSHESILRKQEDVVEECCHLLSPSSNKQADESGASSSFYSSAWMCMQCDLNIVTPSLPAYLDESTRFRILRSYLPQHYIMIPQLLSGQADWKLRASRQKVLVLVQTIQSLTDTLWTVELTDETGSTMLAWIQPALVQEEQQRPQPQYVRPGLVWLVQNPTIILVANDEQDEQQQQQDQVAQKLERMLLISQANIERVWTPSQSSEISDQDYIEWVEKRNTVTTSALEQIQQQQPQQHSLEGELQDADQDGNDNDDEDDDDDEEEFTFDLPSERTGTAPPAPSNTMASPMVRQASSRLALSQPSIERRPTQPNPAEHIPLSSLETSKIAAQRNCSQRSRLEQPPKTMQRSSIEIATATPSVSQHVQQFERRPTPAGAAETTPVPSRENKLPQASNNMNHSRDQPRRSVQRSPTATLSQSTPQYSGRANNQSLSATAHDSLSKAKSNNTKTDFSRFAASAAVVNAMTPLSPFAAAPSNSTSSPAVPNSHSQASARNAPGDLSPQQAKTAPKSANKPTRPSTKTSSAKRKKGKNASNTAASPKTPSTLWTTKDSTVLEMFDDDDDDDVAPLPPASTKARETDVPSPPPPITTTATSTCAVFQAAAFSGVDVDDLFDDDDDDDDDD